MKLTNFSRKIYQKFTIDQGFIISKEFCLECEGIEEASPTDLEESKLLTEDLSVFILLQELKTLRLDFDTNSELSKISFQKLSQLRLKIPSSVLEDSDAYEKLQVFHKTPKFWVEIEMPYIRSHIHEENEHELFQVLEIFNLEELEFIGYRINDEATLAILTSLLEKSNITRINVIIGATRIENKQYQHLFNALSTSCFSNVELWIYEASLDKVKTAEKNCG
ncbi:unnamed protein product [Moneuplotes crassus]|uniref:Uncharacterized protein n=1 Tax=Euplotes crassus TaxID=5936 RepID=A0AAD1XQ96_EUPCR|nr:unnamed protein product [Moneuplotes crassus]